MNISANRATNSPANLKQRFQARASEIKDNHKMVDKLESMATGFLALDQTDLDQDDTPGSVAITDDKGMIAFAQARPFGGVMSFDYLNENGSEIEEHSIQTDLMGTQYTMDIGGVQQQVYQSGNGLLAIMEQIDAMNPPAKES